MGTLARHLWMSSMFGFTGLACGTGEVDLTMAFCGRTQIAQVDKSILLPGTYAT